MKKEKALVDYEVVEIGGRQFVRIKTKYTTRIVNGKKVRSKAPTKNGKMCYVLHIPIEKFDLDRYRR